MAKLLNAAGTPFALTKSSARGGAMPKRGTPLELVVNGNPVKAVVTSNAAWCGDASLALEYIWIEWEGRAVYVTLGYGELASTWAGEEVSVVDGTGPKPEARLVSGKYESVTGDLEREAGRINKFRDTWAKRTA
jgi:hypothetical protein